MGVNYTFRRMTPEDLSAAALAPGAFGESGAERDDVAGLRAGEQRLPGFGANSRGASVAGASWPRVRVRRLPLSSDSNKPVPPGLENPIWTATVVAGAIALISLVCLALMLSGRRDATARLTDDLRTVLHGRQPASGGSERLNPTGLYTIGSTKAEVRAVEGEPTSIRGDTWRYGSSEVRFTLDRVTAWSVSPSRPLRALPLGKDAVTAAARRP